MKYDRGSDEGVILAGFQQVKKVVYGTGEYERMIVGGVSDNILQHVCYRLTH